MANEKAIKTVNQERVIYEPIITWEIVAKSYTLLFPSFIKDGVISIDDAKFITKAILFSLLLLGLLFMNPDSFNVSMVFTN